MHAFMDRMDAVGIANATVVRGVPHECGLLGLILAHIAALQQCWASSWVESCLIMEDDFAMRLPPATAISLIDSFLLDVQSWDVLMLSCNAQQYMNHDGRGHWAPPYAVRVLRGLSAAGYVVKRAYATKVADNLLGAINKLIGECAVYNANDVA